MSLNGPHNDDEGAEFTQEHFWRGWLDSLGEHVAMAFGHRPTVSLGDDRSRTLEFGGPEPLRVTIERMNVKGDA